MVIPTIGIKIQGQKLLNLFPDIPIPRHTEINDNLAKHIIKMLKDNA
jgi:hypothetical protein